MIEEIFFLEIIEFYLKFWLISLFLRWILSFLPGKIFEMVSFVGNLIRFPVKRLFYWIYGVQVLETDFEKSEFVTEAVVDFDCRITSNVTGPLLILTYISAFIFYWANHLYNLSYIWISVILFILAFSIVLMSAPNLKESEELLQVNVKSILKWFAKILFLSLPLYFIIHFFVGNETLAQGVFVLSMLIPLYHHKSEISSEKMMKTKKVKIQEVDPFGK